MHVLKPLFMTAVVALAPVAAEADPVSIYATGSLRAAFGEAVEDFSAAYGAGVTASFGPSGLMRQRIEAGEAAHIFASANMAHPRSVAAAGRGGPVVKFAENRLCAIAAPEFTVTSGSLLKRMLADDT